MMPSLSVLHGFPEVMETPGPSRPLPVLETQPVTQGKLSKEKQQTGLQTNSGLKWGTEIVKGKQEDLYGWNVTLRDLQISNNREFKELTC